MSSETASARVDDGVSTEAPTLAIQGLLVEFRTNNGSVRAVDGVSLEVRSGRRVVIVGESGSGKSTLALASIGLIDSPGRIVAGDIRCGAIDMRTASVAELRGVRGGFAAMIFQDALGSLNPVMTIGAQLFEAIALHRGLRGRAAQTEAVAALREVGVPMPEARLKQYPHEFSGGMRQRVMIAMALVCHPKLLIADEPTTSLDVTTQAGIMELLTRLAADHEMSVLLITHDLGLVAGFADEVLVMYGGAVVEVGTVEEIFYEPKHPYTRRLLSAVPRLTDPRNSYLRTIPGIPPRMFGEPRGCRFEPRCPIGHGRSLCQSEQPILDVPDRTRRVACHFPDEQDEEVADVIALEAPRLASQPLLKVEGLIKDYHVRRGGVGGKKTLRAVNGVSFEIAEGEVLGLVGESGSGKSTVARLILGLAGEASGRVVFRGHELKMLSRRHRALRRGQIQMVFQDPNDSLNPKLTIERIITEPLILQSRESRQATSARVRELLELVGLGPDYLSRRPSGLSGGQKQRVAIARALATNPRLVICDEAVSSLDVSIRGQVLNLLMRLRHQLGLSYLFISHDLSVVRHICDRVAVMYAGSLVEVAETDRLFAAPQHPYTISLLSAVPVPDPRVANIRRRIRLQGDPPDLTESIHGCVFRERCFKAQAVCEREDPALVEHTHGRLSACHFPEQPAPPAVLEP